jgi:hypothetical protein
VTGFAGIDPAVAAWLRLYLEWGFLLFPCEGRIERRNFKAPLVRNGLLEASADPARIAAWWRQYPQALIGIRTGAAPAGSDVVVLDVDNKHEDQNGFATIEKLVGGLPATPRVHTPHGGGVHCYFLAPRELLANTAGAAGAGIGPGLDWRGDRGYVCATSGPASPYSWDPIWDLRIRPLLAVPAVLLPRRAQPDPRPSGQSPPALENVPAYVDSAIRRACHSIETAPCGEQYRTLNRECFGLGQLCGAGLVPRSVALRHLLAAAEKMPSYDPRRPWVKADLDRKVRRSLEDGMRHPREVLLRRRT